MTVDSEQGVTGDAGMMTGSKIASAKKLLASAVPPKDVAKNLGVSLPARYRGVPASAHAWRAIFSVS